MQCRPGLTPLVWGTYGSSQTLSQSWKMNLSLLLTGWKLFFESWHDLRWDMKHLLAAEELMVNNGLIWFDTDFIPGVFRIWVKICCRHYVIISHCDIHPIADLKCSQPESFSNLGSRRWLTPDLFCMESSVRADTGVWIFLVQSHIHSQVQSTFILSYMLLFKYVVLH